MPKPPPTSGLVTRTASRGSFEMTDAAFADATAARDGLPVLALSQKDHSTIDQLSAWLRQVIASHRAGSHTPQDPGPMAPHFHADEEDHGHGHGHSHSHAH